MNKYPEYVEIGTKKYKINTSFWDALRCEKIFRDNSICDYEKTLAIIYILLGEEAMIDFENQEKIVKILTRYLLCGKKPEEMEGNTDEPSMDFEQDLGRIKTSFMSDYQIDLDKTDMHWWKFHDALEGLTDDSVLSRTRMIREEPLSNKKGKEREKWEKAKKQVALRHEKTSQEKELDKYWEEQMKKR